VAPQRPDPGRGLVQARVQEGPRSILVAWGLLLEAFGDALRRGTIDAYPCSVAPWEQRWATLPPDVQAAQRALEQRGQQQASRDPRMGVELDLTDAEDLALLRVFGPWTIYCEADDDHGLTLTTSGEGLECNATVSPGEAVHLRAHLEGRCLAFEDHFHLPPMTTAMPDGDRWRHP